MLQESKAAELHLWRLSLSFPRSGFPYSSNLPAFEGAMGGSLGRVCALGRGPFVELQSSDF